MRSTTEPDHPADPAAIRAEADAAHTAFTRPPRPRPPTRADGPRPLPPPGLDPGRAVPAPRRQAPARRGRPGHGGPGPPGPVRRPLAERRRPPGRLPGRPVPDLGGQGRRPR